MENALKTDFTNANGLVDPVIYREIFLKTNTNFFPNIDAEFPFQILSNFPRTSGAGVKS